MPDSYYCNKANVSWQSSEDARLSPLFVKHMYHNGAWYFFRGDDNCRPWCDSETVGEKINRIDERISRTLWVAIIVSFFISPTVSLGIIGIYGLYQIGTMVHMFWLTAKPSAQRRPERSIWSKNLLRDRKDMQDCAECKHRLTCLMEPRTSIVFEQNN